MPEPWVAVTRAPPVVVGKCPPVMPHILIRIPHKAGHRREDRSSPRRSTWGRLCGSKASVNLGRLSADLSLWPWQGVAAASSPRNPQVDETPNRPMHPEKVLPLFCLLRQQRRMNRRISWADVDPWSGPLSSDVEGGAATCWGNYILEAGRDAESNCYLKVEGNILHDWRRTFKWQSSHVMLYVNLFPLVVQIVSLPVVSARFC